ncbi:MAG: MmcB family DNA repair protein [Alphaproteobacteria bacterium]
MLESVGTAERTILVTRGVGRLLRAMGYGVVTEFGLRTGRRVDVFGLAPDGSMLAVEVKTSVADFRGDAKWPDYLDWCDGFYFAVPPDFPQDLLPEACGLIVADAWDAVILRAAPLRRLAPPRRKHLTLRFALSAAGRLHRMLDPEP